jgi:16S rRNA (uracil1498-N3)-methyltransferase
VERAAAPAVAGFFTGEPLAAGARVLDEEVAHHLRVRRIAPGDAVRLTDGAGQSAVARLVSLDRRSARVDVEAVQLIPEPSAVHLLPPVGDRDRMLWLAEKAVELGVRGWRPVAWRRSRSVSPRGEGEAFRAKVRARMIGALEQSGGAWLPELHAEQPLDALLAALPEGERLVLDADGEPLGAPPAGPVCVAVGPEGGIEPDERERLRGAGFRAVSLGPRVLRFETAGVAVLAVLAVLATLDARPTGAA